MSISKTPNTSSASSSYFIPKSVNDTAIENPIERQEAISKRRTEHDINSLDRQVCFYLSPEEAEIAKVSESEYLSEYLNIRQPLSGKLLCFSPAQLDRVCHELPEQFRARFTQELSLPEDLAGYAFYVGPVPPQVDDNPNQFDRNNRMVLNGDGMVYRLGFERGTATLKTRLMKTPCYYADLAIQFLPEYDRIGFRFLDGGMVRHSLALGTRNQANTAFLVTKEHLIVTFDGARPHIIDPDSLEILDAIGAANEWLGLAPSLIPKQLQQIFQPYSNPAHPVCDCTPNPKYLEFKDADGLYTVNFSQGLSLLQVVDRFRQWLRRQQNDRVLTNSWGGFTDLLLYRFDRQQIRRWRLFLPNGEPVVAKHAIHQMALTEDYIILGDIAFEIELSQIFGPFLFGYILAYLRNQSKNLTELSSLIGSWISSVFFRLVPPRPFAELYLVPRAKVIESLQQQIPDRDLEQTRLIATKITLPREVSHFVVDYQNPEGIITLHSAHSVGWDVTEWISEYDRSVQSECDRSETLWSIQARKAVEQLLVQNVFEPENIKCLRKKDLLGMLPSPVDLNFIARYKIDGNKGTILQMASLSDPGNNRSGCNTWSVAVNTHRDLQRERETETDKTITNLYWISWGFSWEAIPKRIYSEYANRDVRTLPPEALPTEDKPMTLLRLNTKTMEIEDSFEFPIGYFTRSPQFIPSSAPCPPDRDKSTHGYIACVVLADDEQGKAKDEFWIFHADDFKRKPIYRLSHPNVSLGLTIHSSWLPSERIQQARNDYPLEKRQKMRCQFLQRDYSDLVEQHSIRITQKLFQDVIEKHFVPQTSEPELKKEWGIN